MKIIQILLAILSVILPAQYGIASEPFGVYVAPRALLFIQEATAEAELPHKIWGPKKIYSAKMGGSLALGYDFRPMHNLPVRLEIEYSVFDHVSKQGKVRILRKPVELRAKLAVQTLLANAYVDIPTPIGLIPFFGGGMGVAFLKGDLKSPLAGAKATSSVLAGQVGVGCAYEFTPRISAEAGYRFLMMDNITDENPSISMNLRKNRMHQFLFGFRLTF